MHEVKQFRTDWRHAASLGWLCILICLATIYGPPNAQSIANYGPSAYRNGYGIGDSYIAYPPGSNPMCAEGGTVCQDTAYPLAGPGPSSTLLPSATATPYITCVGPNFMAAAWAIDNSFGGTLAVAKTISANGAADSSVNVQSYDGTVINFNTSYGGRGWFATFNPNTGTCTPLREWGNPAGVTGGGGTFEFSKVSVGGNGHIAYGYCTSPNPPGLCSIDPVTGTITVIANLNAIGNLPACGNPPGCTLSGAVAGVGGEVDCTRDLFGAGVGSVCLFSLGVAGENENAWRYWFGVNMANGAVIWRDVKNDLTGCSTSPAWPGGCVTCSTPAVTVGLCTGIAAAPSSWITASAPSCSGSPQVCAGVQCAGGAIAGCQGIHGVGTAVDYANNIYSNISLEKVCNGAGCTVAGPTFDLAGPALGGVPCGGAVVTAGLCSVQSTVLNGAGHRSSMGGGSAGFTSGSPGFIPTMANQSPTVRVANFQTIGRPATDGHNSGNATDNIGTSSSAINGWVGHGMLGFGSFYNGLANANSGHIVCTGIACSITCATNPCFYTANVPETTVHIQMSSADACAALGTAAAPGTWNVVPGLDGSTSNTMQIQSTIGACTSTATGALTAGNCPQPSAVGMDEYIFYSYAPSDVDTSGNQRNARIIHTYMDTCANSQNFYNLVNGNVDVTGHWLVIPTNRECTVGTDNQGNCQRILEIAEAVPSILTSQAPNPPQGLSATVSMLIAPFKELARWVN